MQTFILGNFLSIAILTYTFLHSKASLKVFLNYEGLSVVLGGTIAILLITSKKEFLIELLKTMKILFFGRKSSHVLKQTLLNCAQEIDKGKIPENTGYPFLDKSLGWLSVGLKGNELDKLLVDGASFEISRYHHSSQTLSNLAKYPPALGMVGTVFGIIDIFNNLSTVHGQKSIGESLAFAMTATLYGLIISNFLISPLGELLVQAAEEEEMKLSLIVETVKLWSEGQRAFFVKEHIELYHAA